MPDNIVDKGGVTTCNNQIVNINQEIDECITEGVNKGRRVCTGCDKAEPEQEGTERLVPTRLEISVSMDISVFAFYGYIGYIGGYFFYEYRYIEN